MTAKIAFTLEANKELDEYMNSKAFYVDFGSKIFKGTSNEGIQSIFNLTQVLPGTKLVDPIFNKK